MASRLEEREPCASRLEKRVPGVSASRGGEKETGATSSSIEGEEPCVRAPEVEEKRVEATISGGAITRARDLDQ